MFQSPPRLFVNFTDSRLFAAKVSGFARQLTLEAIEGREFKNYSDAKSFLNEFYGKKKGNFLKASCCINPPSRFVRKAELESPFRAKEKGFVDEYLKEEYNISRKDHLVKVLNGSDGLLFDPEQSHQKELFFCGAKNIEICRCQDELVTMGVYPDSIELGCMSTLAGLRIYNTIVPFSSIVLEVGKNDSLVLIFHQGQITRIRSVPFGIENIIPLIQSELDLKDELSARQLLFSNTFDFTEKGPILLKKLIRELQALIDYHEVQTGQSLSYILISPLSENLCWLPRTLTKAIKLSFMPIQYDTWLEKSRIKLSNAIKTPLEGSDWFNLVSCMTDPY